jgi:hypothetical protein
LCINSIFPTNVKVTTCSGQYHGWDSETRLRWKIEELNSPQWEHTDSIITPSKSRVRRESEECMIKIPVEQIAIIRDSITTYDNGES